MATRRTRPQADSKMPDPKSENLPPGSRSVQRDSLTQLEEDSHPARPDEPTAWERELQERLPPRGDGSQHNQGDDKDTRTVRDEVAEDRAPEPAPLAPAQGGGPRGPNKEF